MIRGLFAATVGNTKNMFSQIWTILNSQKQKTDAKGRGPPGKRAYVTSGICFIRHVKNLFYTSRREWICFIRHDGILFYPPNSFS